MMKLNCMKLHTGGSEPVALNVFMSHVAITSHLNHLININIILSTLIEVFIMKNKDLLASENEKFYLSFSWPVPRYG